MFFFQLRGGIKEALQDKIPNFIVQPKIRHELLVGPVSRVVMPVGSKRIELPKRGQR